MRSGALRTALLFVLYGSLAVLDARAQDVKQAGVDVPAPKRTKFVAPTYPPEAQAAGQRGIVILELVVDVRGKVESVSLVRSVPPFDEAAVSAVRQWEYEITRVGGRAFPVRLTVPITFALKLPTITRAAGIPELRMGAAPALPPEPWSRREVTVEADVTIDADGQVTDALITAGDSPWAEALLQALRGWRFVPSAGEGPLSFQATARFGTGGQGSPRVDLELSNPRRSPVAAVPESSPPEPAPAVAQPTPPVVPGTAAPTPVAPPPATMGSPAPTPAPPPEARAPATPPSSAPAQAPPIEVVPPAPPPPPPPEGGGGSAVRGIRLGTGVPDLVAGRHPLVPPLARLNAVTGKIQVRFAVDASGATSNVETEGPEPLREAARQAVVSWTFRRTKAERLHLHAEFDYGADSAAAVVSLETK